jgi:hypothetical protein
MAELSWTSEAQQMRIVGRSPSALVAVTLTGFLLLGVCDPAFAFRCKSRIIQDGMHEAEVIRLCGEPVSIRDLGYVVRGYRDRGRSSGSVQWRHRGVYGHYLQEVLATEMLFNFGPRKLMRQLVFEGGILTSIRTMGYGYIDYDK